MTATAHTYRISVIPAGAIIDPRLKAMDIRVLALLGRHTNKSGWCYRKQTEMARELGCARGTVQGSLSRLYDAGWVQMQLNGRGSVGPDPDKQPFAAHSYRVLLDNEQVPEAMPEAHDDLGIEGGCQQVGTPGANPDVAPGANPVGTGCQSSVAPLEEVASNFSSEKIEREARARGEGEKPPVSAFKAKWPTAALDDQAQIDSEWDALRLDEALACLDGISPFLSKLKEHKRGTVPAGWKFIREKRWTLLAQANDASPRFVTFKNWSRDWWVVLLARIARGENVGPSIELAVTNPTSSYSVLSPDMPEPDAIAMFKSYPSDGAVMAAWRPWLESRGAKLPNWRDRIWVFLPAERPPGTSALMTAEDDAFREGI